MKLNYKTKSCHSKTVSIMYQLLVWTINAKFNKFVIPVHTAGFYRETWIISGRNPEPVLLLIRTKNTDSGCASSKAESLQMTDLRLIYADSELWSNRQLLKIDLQNSCTSNGCGQSLCSWCWPIEKQALGTRLEKILASHLLDSYQ